MGRALDGKIIVITGASSGIGRAAARLFAVEGARLALVARSKDKLDSLAAELGSEHLTIAADLTMGGEVERMAAEALAHFGRIDVLLANAGAYIPGDVADGDPDAWDKLLALNVNSVFRAVHAVLASMIERQKGDIIVTSSISGHQAIHWEPVYSASKHAVQSFVHGVRRQVSKHRIRVGAIAPGIVLNELWGLADEAEIAERVEARAGLRCEDVAEALLFMLTRPPNVTIRDLVMLPQNQDL